MAAENDINEGPTYVPVQLTPARLAPGAPEALIVEGPVGSGKTARLVEHATELLDNGAAPDDLLVLCATPDAAAAFTARLAAAHGLGAREGHLPARARA